MNPTIEEVKKVADKLGISLSTQIFQAGELQAFAQHWMNVQREIDAQICDDLYEFLGKYDGSAAGTCGDRIRNNTGE